MPLLRHRSIESGRAGAAGTAATGCSPLPDRWNAARVWDRPPRGRLRLRGRGRGRGPNEPRDCPFAVVVPVGRGRPERHRRVADAGARWDASERQTTRSGEEPERPFTFARPVDEEGAVAAASFASAAGLLVRPSGTGGLGRTPHPTAVQGRGRASVRTARLAQCSSAASRVQARGDGNHFLSRATPGRPRRRAGWCCGGSTRSGTPAILRWPVDQ